jgi:hypothetical protein
MGNLSGWTGAANVSSLNSSAVYQVGLGIDGTDDFYSGELVVGANAYSYSEPPEPIAWANASLSQIFDAAAGDRLSLWVRPSITSYSFVGGPHSASVVATVTVLGLGDNVIWQVMPDMGEPLGTPSWAHFTTTPLPAGTYMLRVGLAANTTLIDPPSTQWDAANVGGTLNVDHVQLLPEPSSLILLALGGLGIARRRRVR